MAVEPYTAMFSLRPVEPRDREGVLAALAARDTYDAGDPAFSRDAVIDRWRASGFDARRDSVVAVQDGAIVGYGAVFRPGTLAFVAPGHEGRGIGTELLMFTEQRTRELRHDCYRQRIVRGNAAAEAFLSRAGYAEVRVMWQMVRPLDGVPPPAPPPPDVTLHRLDPDADGRALHAADEAAFATNADYIPETFEDFLTEHLAVEHLDRLASVVARRGAAIAGYAVCLALDPGVGYVDLLAVAADERERGLGTALLHHAFRAFVAQGRREARLDVASDNAGAMRLYERAGMIPRHGAGIWEKAL